MGVDAVGIRLTARVPDPLSQRPIIKEGHEDPEVRDTLAPDYRPR
jgi:hypothetical protein